jgi:effector-binding domain-containing protein
MKYCKFNYITNSNNFTTNSNNFTTNSNNFTTNSNNFTTNSNNFTTNSNNFTTTNSNNFTNKCSICSKKTPDYLSIFTAYSRLIKYIKNKHKEIMGEIL